MLVVRALYGVKSSGAAWRKKLPQTLRDLGYLSSKADPDVWLEVETKPDGEIYQVGLYLISGFRILTSNSSILVTRVSGRSSIQTQKRQYLGMLPLLGYIRYMSDVMLTPIMQAICLPVDFIQGLLPLSIIPQSYRKVSARTQWSHQALAPNS